MDVIESMLDLTLEIISLLTGETFPPMKSGDHVTITVSPSLSLISEKTHKEKILEVIHKMIELLSGEVPIRCQDVAVYLSMEERKYLEGHKELYKAAMMEEEPADKPSSERSPLPPSQDEQCCKEEEPEYKTEEAEGEGEEECCALQCWPYKEEEMLTEIGTDGRITKLPLKLSCDYALCDNGYRSPDLPKPEESSPALPDTSDLHPDLSGVYSVGGSPHPSRDFSPAQPCGVTQSSTRRGRKMYQCPDCGKCFKQSGNLIVHRRVHSGEKPFQCPQCGKAFAHRSNLVQHQIVHKRQAPSAAYGNGLSADLEVGRRQETFGRNILPRKAAVGHNNGTRDTRKSQPGFPNVDLSADLYNHEESSLNKPNTSCVLYGAGRSADLYNPEDLFLNPSLTLQPTARSHSADKSTDVSNAGECEEPTAANPITHPGLYSAAGPPVVYHPEQTTLHKSHASNPNAQKGLQSVDRSPNLSKRERSFLKKSHTVNTNPHPGVHCVVRSPDLSKLQGSSLKKSHAVNSNAHPELFEDRPPNVSQLDGSLLKKSHTVNPSTHPRLHGVDRSVDLSTLEGPLLKRSHTFNPNAHPGMHGEDRSLGLSEVEGSLLSKSHTFNPNAHPGVHDVRRSTDLSNLEESLLNKSHIDTPKTHKGLYSVDRRPDPCSVTEFSPHRLQTDPTQTHLPMLDQKPNLSNLMSSSNQKSCVVAADNSVGFYNVAKSADPSIPKGFPSRKPRTMMHLAHKGQKTYQCPECGKCFKQSGNLIVHRRIHTGEKPFQCLHCGKAFAHRSNLVQHQIVHRGRAFPSSSMSSIGFSPTLGAGRRQRMNRRILKKTPELYPVVSLQCDIDGQDITRASPERNTATSNVHPGLHSEDRSPDLFYPGESPPDNSHIATQDNNGMFYSVDSSSGLCNPKEFSPNDSHTEGLYSMSRSPVLSNSEESILKSHAVGSDSGYRSLNIPNLSFNSKLPIARPYILGRSLDFFNPEEHYEDKINTVGLNRCPALSSPEKSSLDKQYNVGSKIHCYIKDRSPDNLNVKKSSFETHTDNSNLPHFSLNRSPDVLNLEKSSPDETHTGSSNIPYCSLNKSPDLCNLEKSSTTNTHTDDSNIPPYSVSRSPDISNLEKSSAETHTDNSNIPHYSLKKASDLAHLQKSSDEKHTDSINISHYSCNRSPDFSNPEKSDESSNGDLNNHLLGISNLMESTLLHSHPVISVIHQGLNDGEGSPDPCSLMENSAGKQYGYIKSSRQKGRKIYQCPDCGKCFKQSGNLIVHRRIHTGEKPFQCPHCGKAFAHRSNLVQHLTVHRGQMLPPSRGHENSSSQTLDAGSHRETHEVFSCKYCGKCFKHMSNLAAHERVHSGEKPFSCSLCGKGFKQKSALIAHRVAHTGEKPFQCSDCGKSFKQKSVLTVHLKIHTGERPFTCAECGKSFRDNSALLRHHRMHTGEKPYACPDCGKCFAHLANLIPHQRTHTGERPYLCGDCGKSFSSKSYLIDHQSIHKDEKPFSCLECGKSFKRKTVLIQHRIIHTVETPFVCSVCGKGFKRKSSLDQHLQVHAGVKSFSCFQCGRGFSQRSRLRLHERINHSQ